MGMRMYHIWGLLIVFAAFCPWIATAIVVDNTTECDYFATRTTINATYDQCDCEADFTGNGTSCDLQAQLDCSSDAVKDGYAFKVLLNQSYIDYNNISISTLRLLNESCSNVTLEGGYYVLHSPGYDDCGSIKSNTSDQIVYSNAVLNNGGGISTGLVLYLDFTCFVSAFLTIGLSDDNGDPVSIVVDEVASQNIQFPIQGGIGFVSASMYLYKDQNYAEVYNGVPVLSTADTLYVKIALDTVLNGVYIVSRECWATPDAAGSSSQRFDIIEQPGCLKSSVTNGKLTSNGAEEESRFQLAVFTFLPSNVVYLHCEVELCTPTGGGTCQPSCPASGRKRRETLVTVRVLRSSLIIKSSHKITEPHHTPASDDNNTGPSFNQTMFIAILIALLVLLLFVIAALFGYFYFVRQQKST